MIKTELEDYQAEAVERMVAKKRFVLADGTGKGKTLTALATIDRLVAEDPKRRVLVLANKASLPVWKKQVVEHSDMSVLVGTTQDARAVSLAWKTGSFDVIVLTYSSVTPRSVYTRDGSGKILSSTEVKGAYRDDVVRFYEENDGHVVLILEEAHYCKNADTNRHAYVRKLIMCSEYVWMLTATPINNRITDIFFLMDLLIPGFFGVEGDFLREYTVREEVRVSRGRKVKEIVGYKKIDRLKKKLSEFVLKRSLDLDVRFVLRDFDLSDDETSLYLQAAAGILDETKDARDFGARLPDLQMVVDNAVVDGREANVAEKLGSKERSLLEGLRDSYAEKDDRAVVVFCYHVLTFERLRFLLERAVGKLGFDRLLTVEAKHTTDERMTTEREFRAGDLLLMSSAGKESMNLQAADEVWMYNIPWSAGDAMQVVGRVTRMDSEHEVFRVVLLVARGTIDEYKMNVWSHKAEIFRMVLKSESSMLTTKKKVSRTDLKDMRKELLWKTREHRRRR